MPKRKIVGLLSKRDCRSFLQSRLSIIDLSCDPCKLTAWHLNKFFYWGSGDTISFFIVFVCRCRTRSCMLLENISLSIPFIILWDSLVLQVPMTHGSGSVCDTFLLVSTYVLGFGDCC